MPADFWSQYNGGGGAIFQPHVISQTPIGGAGGGGAGAMGAAGTLTGGTGAAAGTDASLIGAYAKNAQAANLQEKARFDKLMGLAKQFGASLMNRNQQMYGQEVAQGNQSLVNRGLYNSSAATAMQTTANDSLSRRNAEVADQQTNLQMGVLNNVQVQRPDSGLMAQLFSQPRSPGATAAGVAAMQVPQLFPTGGAKGSTSIKKKGK
jgi:hypothetical protein